MVLTTAPRPKTATVLPRCTRQVFQTAPQPVATPQPMRHIFSSGASGVIFASEISATTVYSENVEHPMKWKIGTRVPSAFTLVKRDVPSGMKPWPWVLRILGHRFVFGDWQKMQAASRHSGV